MTADVRRIFLPAARRHCRGDGSHVDCGRHTGDRIGRRRFYDALFAIWSWFRRVPIASEEAQLQEVKR